MTGSATGEPGRGGNAPTRTTRTRETAGAIVVLLALGLAFRLIFAYLAPDTGFQNDLISFRAWAMNLATEGIPGFYERPFLHDYTPGYMYVLWAIGSVTRFLDPAGGPGGLVKLPAIVADVALAWLVWSMILELGGRRRAALVGAAIVLVNPITWFDSVVWGQVDSVGVVFLLLGIRELWRGRFERAAVFAVVAAIVKPQLGILAPVVAVVTISRAIRPPDPSESRRPLRIVTTGLAGFVTALVLSSPFGLSVLEPSPTFPFLDSDLIRQVLTTAAGYPYATVNAWNPWALIEAGGQGLAETGTWLCDLPDLPACAAPVAMIGSLPAALVGGILFLPVLAVVLWRVALRPDRLTVLVGVVVLAVAFFVVPTRVHERYLFPFFPLAAVLAAVSGRWRLPYIALSVANLANLYWVLAFRYDMPTADDWLGIGPFLAERPVIATFALVHLAGSVWVLLQLRSRAMERLAGETEPERPAAAEPGKAVLGAPGAWLAPEAGQALRRWTASPAEDAPGIWAAARRALLRRPVRADRSRGLHREPGGRLERIDLWLLVVLVAAVLCLRIFRLAEPYQMHFDEVYHARTATEFLQKWRYDEDHHIYEYTHPHLAKYAMAAGIVLLADDRATVDSRIGEPVRDAVVETRWDDPTLPDGRAGDRVYVATGADVRAYDLRTRALVGTIEAAGATALAIDPAGHRLFVGTEGGEILVLDTSVSLDFVRTSGEADPTFLPDPFAAPGAPVSLLHATDDGSAVLAVVGDEVISYDADVGAELGRAAVPGATDLAGAGSGDVLHADPVAVPDHAAAAATLAQIIGGDAASYEDRLGAATEDVVFASALDPETREAVDAAIGDGRLAGFDFRSEPRVGVANPGDLVLITPATGEIAATVAVGPSTGLDLITGVDHATLYVATRREVTFVDVAPVDASRGPVVTGHLAMPGEVERVVYDVATELVHVEGVAPDGEGRTVYVIEPHGNAVFADVRLPFEPVAIAADAALQYPASDRQELLAFSADGSVATVEAGRYQFAWRLPGVVAGALMAGLVFLLARILFRRRSVAVMAGLLTLVEGMLFVQSRIAMNDAYVGLFIVAAYTVFAAVWTSWWRWRGAFWVAMPLIGVLLGLALASKWVAAYAIAALGVLVLARSALGRLLLIGGLVLATTVLGYAAVSVPEGATSGGNLFFLLLMIGLTLVAVVASVLHPIAWSNEEVRLAVGAPVLLGGLVALGALALGRISSAVPLGPAEVTPLHLAFALTVAGALAAVGFIVAGRAGFGPLAPPLAPDDPVLLAGPPSPAPTGWLNLGSWFGLPVAWMAVCMLALTVAIYVASYVPWAMLDGNQLVPGWPPGHEGQTLVELTKGMYDYHNNLRASHAASSPWWAWPFDLKPVWFYQGGFAASTAGAVYDAGNLAIWWLAIPAMAFCAWQAWKRRSPALALVAIGFAWQWLPWVRIDRATFQYHYYTSVPFIILALAYLLAELWHGASMRTWLMARLTASVAVLGPALLWFGKAPLCAYVRVEAVNAGSQACVGNPGNLVVTGRVGGLVLVVGLAIVALLWQLARLDRPDAGGRVAPGRRLGLMGLTAAGAFGLMTVANAVLPETPVISMPAFSTELVAVVLAIPLVVVAAFVATARDARRFVVGVLIAAIAWFVVWYPNLSALPLPATIVNAYQGVLPTYLYPFQFPVNTDPAGASPPLIAFEPAILLVALTVTAIVLGYSAWVWRIALAERVADAGGDNDGRAGLAPSGGEA